MAGKDLRFVMFFSGIIGQRSLARQAGLQVMFICGSINVAEIAEFFQSAWIAAVARVARVSRENPVLPFARKSNDVIQKIVSIDATA